MSSNFQKAIDIIRKKAINETEKGYAFEKLSKIYFENDDVQKQFYKKVWHYKDWARENPNFSKIEIGIDLVGELKNNGGFAAIQCKFFKSENQITKKDLDSFVSASSNDIFTRLILIDTSNQDLGSNAKSMLNNLNKTYQRIQKFDLENSRIDWLEYLENKKIILSKKKPPLDHQIQAIEEAKKYYSSNDRGKMIMACGTGKTYTSLKITETIANKKFILYMVPSLALMSQSIREWKNDCEEEFIAFSACSDKKVGKVRNDNDQIQINLNELAIPATTDSKKLSEEIAKIEKNKMKVIFSTYQSIDVISDAQKKYNMDPFDLIICDEAHRTTGATFEGEEDSNFVKIHDNKYVEGKKRLYMTATPRIFGNKAKRKADEGRVELASMDDFEKYGNEFFNRGFNWAVENNLLSDYKVVILAIDESLVSMNLQKSLQDGSELKLTDATKIIGVYKALAKVGFDKKENEKLKPIKKAIAFSQSIDISKIFEKEFSRVVKEYVQNENVKNENKVNLNVEMQHIDGSFNADQRNNHLNWLKDDTHNNTCRILSNVKCLSEGVDVPSLDAIIFLHPKKSQIDVVQAVGRVMRKAEGKDLGYVIIPVTVAPGVNPEKALNDNENYKIVWQIVNALRTHDEKLDSKINLLGLGEDVSDKIEIVTMSAEQDATTAKIEDVAKKKPRSEKDDDDVVINDDSKNDGEKPSSDKQMSFELDDLSQAIKAKIVKKCGTRDYWENWATDIADIAKKHIANINSILVKKNSKEAKYFDKFLRELRDDLNPEINESDAVDMMAQHIITKPVFEKLFEGNKFTNDNPISKVIENVVSKIYNTKIDTENKSLEKLYQSIERRSSGILSSKSRANLINELYERFFKNAFPLITKKLGIVYTPIEIVDFILSSTNYLLKSNFNKSFNDKNIQILDPFLGTGTFLTRLLSMGLIEKDKMSYKYQNEIHGNEIVLLAYYIASINIESAYHDIVSSNNYVQFNGSVLTDTFQLYEQNKDMIADLLPDNSKKRKKQKELNIKIII
jgi:predicted helicase